MFLLLITYMNSKYVLKLSEETTCSTHRLKKIVLLLTVFQCALCIINMSKPHKNKKILHTFRHDNFRFIEWLYQQQEHWRQRFTDVHFHLFKYRYKDIKRYNNVIDRQYYTVVVYKFTQTQSTEGHPLGNKHVYWV